ncbi:hypothetical protein FAM09_15085 [Niastella caeni]|uniref:Uncharacterized protein n=1 Tax=Niastella caeni TaxID=2569763 RepID=A0A4S8HTQ5_9BACT|nr:hypothetical protein [Niastella caeni]THU38009.1 hypothetical protein FAM09_15085 [Niastella caeni]
MKITEIDILKDKTTMRLIIQFIIIILFTSVTFTSVGQITDSVQTTAVSADTLSTVQTENFHEEVDEGFEPGLALFALFGIGFMFICVGAFVAAGVSFNEFHAFANT